MLTALASGAALGIFNLAHCAGMCGPLCSATCMRSGSRGLLRYQLGRTLAYTFFGAMGGHLGQALGIHRPTRVSVWLFAGLTAAACLLTARGLLRAAGAQSRPIALHVSEGSRATRRRRGSTVAALWRLVPREPFVFGLVSVLLPCGVLGAALLAAVAAASPYAGAALMAAFATVSGVAVIAAGWLVQRARRRFTAAVRRALACALFVGAAVSIARPLAVHGAPDAARQASVHCH